MSRSCHSATFSSAAWALPRSTRARPAICSLLIGLRLCGIAEDPFWPARNGSCTSRTSVRCRWRTSVAMRSRPAPASAIAPSSSAWRSRGTTCVETSSRASPRRASTAASNSGLVAAYVPTAPDSAPTATCAKARSQALGVAVRLEREARELDAERGRLGVHAVGAPDAQRVRVLARARDQRGHERAGARHDHLAGRAQLQRERRVEHVRGGQPEVDPAPRLADRRREHVDERGHVVLGHQLALLHLGDREARAADRLQLGLVGPVAPRAGRAAPRTPRARPDARLSMRASSLHRRPSSGRV